MPLVTSINLNIAERLLSDIEFRRDFFHTQAVDGIAISIKTLRRMRNKRQIDLAQESGMLQSAISRIEQADYGKYSLNTLFRVADALGARLRISFDPVEDVVADYEKAETEAEPGGQYAYHRESDTNRGAILKRDLRDTKDSQSLISGLPAAA